MTKDARLEVRKFLVSRFASLSREILKSHTEDRGKKKQLERMEEECYGFQAYLEEEVTYLGAAIPRCKTLIESCLKIYMQCYGKTYDSFVENENFSKKLSNDNDTEVLQSYVRSIRVAASKRGFGMFQSDYDEDEGSAVLFLSLTVLEKLYHGILASPKTPPDTSPRKLQSTHQNGSLKLEIDDLVFSTNGTVVLVNEKDHPTVCMENASGLPCYRHCKEHSSDKLVYLSFTTIGTVKCNFGEDCKKNKKVFRMQNGTELSVCPYLHGDQFDEIKHKIGQGWLSYSKNTIHFNDIFAIADPKAENGKINLVNSKRCKFLPCMENACGAPCNHHCAEHSDEFNVFYSYTKIGSEKCEYGQSCKKFQKNILLADGRTCNQCPFLHGDRFDEIKKRIGLGWTLYACGSVTFDQVFSDEDLSHYTIINKFLV
jgi:hypothetical protein